MLTALATRVGLPASFEDFLLAELGRAREAVVELRRKHPDSPADLLARKLIETKTLQAARAGGITGLFGVASIPVDAVLIAYLQLSLAVELAVVYGVNLKSARGRQDLLELLGWDRGNLDSLASLLAAVAARVGGAIARRSAWRLAGRAVPVIAAPLTAWFNHRELRRLGEAGMRAFGTFRQPLPAIRPDAAAVPPETSWT